METIYRRRMREDFPPAELKSLASIEKALARGGYACYGAVAGEEILAYAFFILLARSALVDYFAVRKDLRNRGFGSRFLQALMTCSLRDCDCVLLEVEDPGATDDAREAVLRSRRLRFYLRNGLRETGLVARVWGVQYRVLALPIGEPYGDGQHRALYEALYRSFLPASIYEQKIRLLDAQEAFVSDPNRSPGGAHGPSAT